ncbi:transcriptional regulator, TetR family [Nocardia amikacinitolerans]|uniref:Transcriptional regulator, TetR family n=2 Tax=Nocardia amikacinitolerans TaxID=756689 RepID=A0A285M2M4_9NOCA|nr:transcriptional regulator, TetR family [Nocardia amikacinitolerans]SNY89771.1 transcriptional regulator, TetR family [Nocardia amikacinitolerans]
MRDNASMSLRDRKKERTRRAIADAALRLFAERGFDAVTIADIAAAAEVGTRTLHRYYSGKDELLFAEDDEHRAELARLLAERPAGEDPETTLAAVIGPMVAHFADRLDELRTRDSLIAANPALQARDLAKRGAIEAILTTHLAHQMGVDPATDVRPLLWAKVGMSCFFAGFEIWLRSGGNLADHVAAARTALVAELGATS